MAMNTVEYLNMLNDQKKKKTKDDQKASTQSTSTQSTATFSASSGGIVTISTAIQRSIE